MALGDTTCIDPNEHHFPAPVTATPPGRPDSGRMPVAGQRYQLKEEIARGGIGVILRAHDTLLDRPVAVKMLHEQHRGNVCIVRRFFNEAKIIAKLQHPGIIPVYDLGRFSERPFISMPLIRGKTLGDALAERATPEQDLRRHLKVFEKICEVVAYAHAQGVVHRDLKPDNIMIGPFGEVFVMDWGIAKMLDGPDVEAPEGNEESAEAQMPQVVGAELTNVGSVLGTPAFIPPEQARGETNKIDKRSDVYSLGATLCAILTGKGPYRGTKSGQMLLQAQKGVTEKALRRLNARVVDPELADIAKNCLEPEADDRPRDAHEVARRITRYLESKTEEFARAWLNLTTDGIWDWNLETDDEYLSPRFKQLFGYEDDELPNRADSWKRLIAPDDLKRALRAFQEHTHEGKPYNLPVRYRHKNGSTVWVLCRGVALKNDEGRFVRMVGTHTDITALKQAEESLAERGRLAEMGANIGICLTRPGGLVENLQGCSEALVRHLGVALARIWTISECGNFLELQASAGMYRHRDGFHSRVRVGQFKIGRIAQKRRPHFTNSVIGDSEIHDQEWARGEGLVAFAGLPLLFAGRILGVVAMFSRQPFSPAVFGAVETAADSIASAITHFRDTEQLRLSEERFALAIQGTDEGIWDWNVLTGEVYYSARLKELLGYAEHELPHRYEEFESRLHPADRDWVLQSLQEHLEGRSRYQVDYRLRTKSGKYRWFHARGQALWDSDGRAVRMAGSISDIHERKKVEELLRGLLELSPDAQVIINQAGEITLVNRELERLFGYGREELLGQPVEILVPSSVRARHIALRDGYMRSPNRRPMSNVPNLCARHKAGHEFPVEIKVSPLETVDGLFISCVVRAAGKSAGRSV
jgi:PAS domain S-box-containing protein